MKIEALFLIIHFLPENTKAQWIWNKSETLTLSFGSFYLDMKKSSSYVNKTPHMSQ